MDDDKGTSTFEGFMGFYLGNSLRAGPFRLNLSKSGIGVSVGVPGFRVGSGPRGNYVRVGGQSTYFTNRTPIAHQPLPPRPVNPMPPPVAMFAMDGAPVQHLEAANPSEIVSQLKDAERRIRWWPFAAAAIVLIALCALPWGLLLLPIGIPLVWWLWQNDRARRSVVVFYEVEQESAARYDNLAGAHQFTSQSQLIWHVDAQGSLVTPYQQKVSGGATALTKRSTAAVGTAGPPVLVTNILVPSLNTPQRSIFFLPDRALLRQGKNYAEIPYQWLQVHAQYQQFIEDRRVPADSQLVGYTWQYANANGGPDRRFKDNRQLPVMLYGRLTLSTQHGFLMVWDFSRAEVAFALADSLQQMAQR